MLVQLDGWNVAAVVAGLGDSRLSFIALGPSVQIDNVK